MNQSKEIVKVSIFKKIFGGVGNLNSTLILFICLLYAVGLLTVFTIIKPEYNYIAIPTYDHVIYHEDVNPYIHLTANRSYNEEESKFDLSYDVIAVITSSASGEDGRRENLKFSMSALTTANKMYYFTDMSGYNTPISHSFSMDNRDKDQVPSALFINLRYMKRVFDDQNNMTREWASTSLREEVMGVLVEDENNVYHSNNLSVEDFFTVLLTVNKDESSTTDRYTTRININIPDKTKRFHVDMQSWLVDESGENVYPYIGVYGYSSYSTNYSSIGSQPIDSRLNAKTLYVKAVYYDELDNVKTLLYKNDLENLVSGQTITEEDVLPPTVNSDGVSAWVYVGVGFGTLVAALGVAGVIIYMKKKSKTAV